MYLFHQINIQMYSILHFISNLRKILFWSTHKVTISHINFYNFFLFFIQLFSNVACFSFTERIIFLAYKFYLTCLICWLFKFKECLFYKFHIDISMCRRIWETLIQLKNCILIITSDKKEWRCSILKHRFRCYRWSI